LEIRKMKNVLKATTVLVLVPLFASAETVNDGMAAAVKSNVASTLTSTGVSTSASLGVAGFGSAGVVVSNSGLNIALQPQANAFSNLGLNAGAGLPNESGLFDTGTNSISATNERTVEVSGVLSGLGTVLASGTTATQFDGKILASATGAGDFLAGTENYGPIGLEQSFQVDGSARLAGDSSTTADLALSGTSDDFIGDLGATVIGGFDAVANISGSSELFDIVVGLGDGVDAGASLSVETSDEDLNLSIANLGGGLMTLSGANSDVFDGAVSSSIDTKVQLTTDEFSLEDLGDSVIDGAGILPILAVGVFGGEGVLGLLINPYDS